MRQNIADRTTFDSSMIPSDQALYFHWKRACWVIHMWSQADSHNMVMEPITEYGWSVHNDQLRVVWDTDENMAAVRDRVNVLLKGCKCASGCQNRRCGCQRKNSMCTEGCQCTDCQNCPNSHSTPQTEESDDVLTIALEEEVTNNGHLNGEDDEFAEFVFAAQFDSECVESNEDSL